MEMCPHQEISNTLDFKMEEALLLFMNQSELCVFCFAGDWVWDLFVFVGEVSGRREATVAKSSGCWISPQAMCATTFITVSLIKG